MSLAGASRFAPVPLRLAVGAVLCYHGYQKCMVPGKLDEFLGFVKTFGLPNPEILGQVAAWGEFIGGALIIIGLATRIAAWINCGTMFVAIWKVHLGTPILDGITKNFSLKNGEGYEFPLTLLAACLALVFMGGGALSIDSYIGKKGPSSS